MKKTFILTIAALLFTTSMQAQTVTINKTDGTTVTYQANEIKNILFSPSETTIAGNYTGTNILTVGQFGSFPTNDIVYQITANADGTIDVTAPEEHYTGITMMGDLTLGTYTVKNLTYDETTKSYERDYSDDGITVHVKSSNGMDKDYPFNTSKITVILSEDGTLTIQNSYKLGKMPFPISAVFTGKKN